MVRGGFVLPLEAWLPAFTQLSLQSWGQWFALCSPFSYRPEKSVFFSLFRFLAVVWREWQLPSPCRAEPETGPKSLP